MLSRILGLRFSASCISVRITGVHESSFSRSAFDFTCPPHCNSPCSISIFPTQLIRAWVYTSRIVYHFPFCFAGYLVVFWASHSLNRSHILSSNPRIPLLDSPHTPMVAFCLLLHRRARRRGVLHARLTHRNSTRTSTGFLFLAGEFHPHAQHSLIHNRHWMETSPCSIFFHSAYWVIGGGGTHLVRCSFFGGLVALCFSTRVL